MAADGKVQIDFSASQQALVAAYEQQSREIDKLSMKLATLEEKSKKSSKETASGFDKVAQSVKAAADSFLTAGNAIRAIDVIFETVNQRFAEFAGRVQTAGQFQTGMAGSAMQAIINLAPSADITAKQLEEQIGKISQQTGAKRESLWAAASGVLSASTEFTASQAIEQLGEIAAINPFLDAAGMQAMSGTALDLRKQFGGTAKEITGAMAEAARTNRAESLRDFGMNVAPALMQIGKFGGSFEEAVAFTSAISQESGDVTGRRSGTAAINFMKELVEKTAGQVPEDASPGERLEWLLSGTPTAEMRRRGALATITGQHAMAAAVPGGAMTGEAKQYMALVELLQQGKTHRIFENIMRETPSIEAGAEIVDEIKRRSEEIGVIRTGRAGAAQQAVAETVLSSPEMGKIGAVREQLERTLKQIGVYGTAEETEGAFPVLGEVPIIRNLFGGALRGTTWMDMRRFDEMVQEGQDANEAAMSILRERRQGQKDLEEHWALPLEPTVESRAIDKQLDEIIGSGELLGGEGGDRLFGGTRSEPSSINRIESLLQQLVENTSYKGIQDVRVIEDERSVAARRRQPHQQAVRNIPVAGK